MDCKETIITGIGVSPGIGIGQAYIVQKRAADVERRTSSDPAHERERLARALAEADQQIASLAEGIRQRAGESEAAIFEAHRMMLQDPEFRAGIEGRIDSEHASAEHAVQSTAAQYIAMFDAIDDDYLKARAADVQDISERLLSILSGKGGAPGSALPDRAILIAEELLPTDTVSLDGSRVAGIVTERGGATSHAAILAKSLGIPAVAGAKGLLLSVRQGDAVIADGDAGVAVSHPAAAIIAAYEAKREIQLRRQRELSSQIGERTVSLDGHAIELFGNIGRPSDVDAVLENDGEGIGLYRTEFLFMGRDRLPSEQEQYEAYRSVLAAMGGRPVTLRTLDAGGDKELPYLNVPQEENPFLGARAIRLCLAHPDIFRTQLRAAFRASVHGNLRLMLPMVTTLSEVRQAKAIIDRVRKDLRSEGVSFIGDIPVGIMIETPAAALHADALAREVDFFSIGTNDLIQYTAACDRGNAETAGLYTPYHPAVLKLIQLAIESARRAGIHVGMCGEAAGDELLIPVFLAMGLDSFSTDAGSILRTRYAIRNALRDRPEVYLRDLLQLPTAEDVVEYLQRTTN